MLQQAIDLREEGEALNEFLQVLADKDWNRPTQFKGMTPGDVVAHLHVFDRVALLSLDDPDDFLTVAWDLVSKVGEECKGVAPAALRQRWYACLLEMCEKLGKSDPHRRLQWFGPSMGVRMFASARQMETWAHGQEIYDLMRASRLHTDRLKNIAHLGVRTYAWTFQNRGLEIPGAAPYVRLSAPSGAIWEWNEPCEDNRIEGKAVEFCQVVTQVRNIADTTLVVTGEPARQWMAIAQCFAGPPEEPPKPGERAW